MTNSFTRGEREGGRRTRGSVGIVKRQFWGSSHRRFAICDSLACFGDDQVGIELGLYLRVSSGGDRVPPSKSACLCAGLAQTGPAADRNEIVYGLSNRIGGTACVVLIIGIVPANVVCQSASRAGEQR